jgi:hypothetical protein
MTRFTKFLAVAATAALAAGGAGLLAGPAQAQPNISPVQPKQYFAGQVNGNTASSVLSVLGCPPPAATGAPTTDGHPMPGQTVDAELFLVPPPVAVGTDFLGYTGRAHKLSVSLVVSLAEPPLAYEIHIADLTTYNTTAPIPTTLNIPCAGATYQMVFSPVSGGAKAMTSTVSLSLGIPRIVTVPTPVAAQTQPIELRGTGFVPATTYTVEECSSTGWVVPQNPCVGTNNVQVTTDTTGAFTTLFSPVPCTAILPSTCYVGVPTPQGVDTITLAGADKIIVP